MVVGSDDAEEQGKRDQNGVKNVFVDTREPENNKCEWGSTKTYKQWSNGREQRWQCMQGSLRRMKVKV